MITALRIQYPMELSYEYSFLDEFLKLCGIFVYDGKDEDIAEEKKEIKSVQLIEAEFGQSQSIQGNYLEIKKKLQLNPIEEQYMDWLWDLYYARDVQKDLFFALLKKSSFSDIEIQESEFKLLGRMLKHIEAASDYKCYSRYYGMAKLQYILCGEKKSKGKDVESELHEIALSCHMAQLYGKEELSITELMGDIYINIVNDYSLGLTYYTQCITDYNYKVLRKIARYYETRIVDPRRELQYLERAINCRKEYYEARYRLARKLEQEQLKFEKALEEYELIADKLDNIQRIKWLTPEEFQVICRTWKRIGCISYKYLEIPACEYGLQSYQKIYEIWENCGKNKYISSMNPGKQKEMVALYQSLYSIEHVQRSEENIRRKMQEVHEKMYS